LMAAQKNKLRPVQSLQQLLFLAKSVVGFA